MISEFLTPTAFDNKSTLGRRTELHTNPEGVEQAGIGREIAIRRLYYDLPISSHGAKISQEKEPRITRISRIKKEERLIRNPAYTPSFSGVDNADLSVPIREIRGSSLLVLATPGCGTPSGFVPFRRSFSQGGAATPLTLGFAVQPLRGKSLTSLIPESTNFQRRNV